MFSSVLERLNTRRSGEGEAGADAGFTLIELMVVLLILAILLAIAIPTFLGVTGGANDRAAQSNLNTALTTAKAWATQNNQSYTGVTAAILHTNEPSITFDDVTTETTQGPVSVFPSGDGNGIVLASYSKNKNTCWYAVDNLSAVTSATGAYSGTLQPTGTATAAPSNSGTYYVSSTGACNSNAVVGAGTWGSHF